MNNATTVALVLALLGPLVTYLVSVRRLSGKIATSAADELWAESRNIREEQRKRNEFLSGKIEKLEKRIDELEGLNTKLYLENGTLRRMIEQHEETIKELRLHIRNLDDDNIALREENRLLKMRVLELENNSG